MKKSYLLKLGGGRKEKKLNQKLREKTLKNEKISKNELTSKESEVNQYSGNVMVDFSLAGRTAHNNNNWHIRNPGYTCGYNAAGIVVILIKVNAAGKVVKIEFDAAKSTNVSNCMKEQALKYAKISRFNASTNGGIEQSGYIRYQFVSQ